MDGLEFNGYYCGAVLTLIFGVGLVDMGSFLFDRGMRGWSVLVSCAGYMTLSASVLCLGAWLK